MSNCEVILKPKQKTSPQLTLSVEVSRAKTFPWLGAVKGWLEREAPSGMNIFGWSERYGLLGSLLKMSLASYLRTKARTLKSSSGVLPNAGMVWRGACWIASSSEFPSAAAESSLSDILERRAHQKYYLSQKACQGILRRAARRMKKLPERLAEALERGAGGTTLTGKEPSSSTDTSPLTIPATRLLPPTPSAPDAPPPAATGESATSSQAAREHPDREDPALPKRRNTAWSVRRLTPMECERLQGFPDGWTLLPQTGSDTPPLGTL